MSVLAENWLAVAVIVTVPVLAVLVGWLWLQSFATRREVAEVATEVAVLGERIKRLPTDDSLRRIHDKIDKLTTTVADVGKETAATAQAVKSMGTTVDLLHEHHMGGGK